MTTEFPVEPTGADVAIAALEAVMQLYRDTPDGDVRPECEYGMLLWAALRAAYPNVPEQDWSTDDLPPGVVALADAAALLMCAGTESSPDSTPAALPESVRSLDRAGVQAIVDRAIRQHELRVAVVSGLLGLALLAGTWHAIWLTAGNAQ